ncbi:hypothetical protein ACSBOB_14745 [Mesorhizobium sp. ASY16-5R]|uniref:hypothetical protein n=1 Tax=Mesorhizobium sp. ASY16-5R TaxID=3445772 RepID=UPI003F9F788E
MVGNFNPKDNDFSTSIRPAHVNTDAGVEKWASNAGPGTRIHDQDWNSIIAQFRNARAYFSITDVEGDDTLLRQLLLRAIQPSKNYILNPSFDIWQSGVTQSGAGVATSAYAAADLWKVRGASGSTYSRQAGFSGSRYCMRVGVDPGASTNSDARRVGQALPRELVLQLAGKKVVLSADIRAGADFSGTSISATISTGTASGDEQFGMDLGSSVAFATGGVSSGQLGPKVISPTAQRHTFAPYIIPANATHLAIRFLYGAGVVGTAGANDYFEITNVKLEVGDLATPFEVPDLAVQRAWALRYYQQSPNAATAPAQNLGAGTGEFTFPAPVAGANTERAPRIIFPVPMRGTPAVTLYNPAAANAQVRDLTAGADCSAAAASAITEKGFDLACTGNASTVVGGKLGVHWAADARNL